MLLKDRGREEVEREQVDLRNSAYGFFTKIFCYCAISLKIGKNPKFWNSFNCCSGGLNVGCSEHSNGEAVSLIYSFYWTADDL